MTVFSLENALLGKAVDRPAINDPTIPRHGSQPPTYICIDTLEVFQDTGSDWLLVGHFGLTGVTSDSQGNMTITGALTAGNSAADVLPDFNQLYGVVEVQDTYATNVDGDVVLSVTQSSLVDGATNPNCALVVARSGTLSAADYQEPAVLINDSTASTQPVFEVEKSNVIRLRVDATGAQVSGVLTASNATLAGAGGTTPTLAVTKLAGQTGLFIAITDENAVPKVSIAVDGEIVTADDVLAPSGVIKGATVALYPSGTGAPSSGLHSQGEFHADTAGALFYCTVSGTPGTWAQVTLT